MHPLDIIFWACLMLGGAYTLITLLMGGISDIAGHVAGGEGIDASFGHDLGHDLGLDHAGEFGGHTGDLAPAHDGGIDAADGGGGAFSADHLAGDHAAGEGHGFSVFSYLSPVTVASFLLGFGGLGVVTRLLHTPPLQSLLAALTGGLGLWMVAFLLITRMFAAAQSSSNVRTDELIGRRALVTAMISGRTPGMVCYTVAGTRQSVPAITEEGEVIPTGSAVRIRRIENRTARVTRID